MYLPLVSVNLSYSIYQKSTATDAIIRNTSRHPTEDELSAINYTINRPNTKPWKRMTRTQKRI
jgi:hypothetical protein